MRDDIGLERAQRVHSSEGCEHGAPGAKDDEPSAEAAFGVGEVILGEGRGDRRALRREG